MIMHIAVFLIGVIIGAVGVMVLSVLMVDGMKKRDLTKEEWKMGIHPDHPDGDLYVVAYMIAAVVVFGVLIYVICYK